MKILIVAHPDDEALWFVPSNFDKIIIVFCDRHDKPLAGDARRMALFEHPLKDRIINLNVPESGYWKDKRRILQFEASKSRSRIKLEELRRSLAVTTVFTHNSTGEYGHDDHILVHNVCKEVFRGEIYCPVFDLHKYAELQQTVDQDLYQKIKTVYAKYRVWTWRDDYVMPLHLRFGRL